MAVKVADTLKPMGNFPIAEAMDVAFGDGESLQKKLDDGTLGGGGDKIQYDIMPNATAELSGKIIQFTGDTGTYVSGAFYKCVEKEGSFAWEKVSSDSYDDTEIREEIEKKAEIDDSDKESTTTTLSAKAISDSLVDKAEIDDTTSSTTKTYSSKKIDNKTHLICDAITDCNKGIPKENCTETFLCATPSNRPTGSGTWGILVTSRYGNTISQTYNDTVLPYKSYKRTISVSGDAIVIQSDWQELATMNKVGNKCLKVGTVSGTPNDSGNLSANVSEGTIFILSGASKNACVSPFTYNGRWTFHCTGFGQTYTPVTTELSIEYVYYEL